MVKRAGEASYSYQYYSFQCTIVLTINFEPSCPRFAQHREILKEASRDIALPEILGTKEGITALSEFIRKSGAFTRSGQPPTPPQTPNFENEPEAPAEEEPRLTHNDGG